MAAAAFFVFLSRSPAKPSDREECAEAAEDHGHEKNPKAGPTPSLRKLGVGPVNSSDQGGQADEPEDALNGAVNLIGRIAMLLQE